MPCDTAPPTQSAAVSSQQDSPGGNDEFTRLHITPLDANLLKVIVPASALPNARNISYHTLATFPEKRYGFVDLPKVDADKIRAKLNGAVLKGSKMRIEKARPEKKTEPSDMEEKKSKKDKKEKKSSKDKSESSRKRKRDDNVVDGVALTDRKVKRGWTETPIESAKRKKKERSEKGSKDKDKEKSKDKEEKKSKDKEEKKKRTKSKYTDQEECLLKTKVPANLASNLPKDDSSHKKKKKNKGSSREVTVHEFEKTTKFPSFLKDSGSSSSRPAATEYVEGKGWVDEDGNTVEAVTVKKPTKPAKPSPKKKPVQEEDSDDTSSSGTSSDGESEVDNPGKKQAESEDDSDTSSSGSSSDEDEDVPKSVEPTTPAPVVKGQPSQPASSPTSRNLKINIPPTDTHSETKVHPLEALYKKKPTGEATETPAKEAEPFSFFGGAEEEDAEEEDAEEEDAEQAPPMPMTPFTRQDYEWRNVRSAAPTPDTAHPSRMQNIWTSQHDDDDDIEDAGAAEDEEEDAGPSGKNPASDFQSWFWENRRDLNQSWMRRRKTAAKEKRHRENKARASKAV
ncbi:hypothetical protein ACO1O0_001790 [Amphichorda felina]